jgi:hypothetical protein
VTAEPARPQAAVIAAESVREPDRAAPPPEVAREPDGAPPPPEVVLEPDGPLVLEPDGAPPPAPLAERAPPAPPETSPGPAPAPRARSVGDWSDEQAGLAGVRGDLAWARRRGQLDLACTLGLFLLTMLLGTLVCVHFDAHPLAPLLVIAGAIGAAQLLGWWQLRRLKVELAHRMARREQAIRAAAPLVDDAAVRRPGRDLHALEGWRDGLPVELSVTIRLAPDEPDAPEDAIVVRVGAPPASRRPRAVTRHDWLGAPATTVPDSLAGWRAQRSLAALRATELLRRFRLGSIAWGPDGVELRGPADHRLLGHARLDALLAAGVGLAQACGLAAVTRVRVLGEQASQAFCPFCRDELALADRAACLACGTEHHLQCITEHGRCTVWGCGRTWVTARVRARERT